jgi:hypothetical protein
MKITITASDVQTMSGLIQCELPAAPVLLAKLDKEREGFWLDMGKAFQAGFEAQ